MPITDTNVIDGPNEQEDGELRGVIQFVFDDGRAVTKTVRATDNLAWTNKILDLPAQVEAQVQTQDAEEVAERDEEIVEYKEASKKHIALAKLRKARVEEYPYDAYRKFSRFNDYRIAQGLTVAQVQAHLADVGLTQEEWDDLLAAYQWVTDSGRVTAMVAYEAIRNEWPTYRG